jgi:hypothetical protein
MGTFFERWRREPGVMASCDAAAVRAGREERTAKAANTRRAVRASNIPEESITKCEDGSYLVCSSDGSQNYRVIPGASCTCLDFQQHAAVCKHRLRVQQLIAAQVPAPPKPAVGDVWANFDEA